MTGIKDFVEAYAKERAISKVEADKEVRTFLKVLKDKCVEDDGVAFKGYFSLSKKVRKGRTGKVNGHEYTTSDKTTLKLSVYSAMEEALQ